MKETCHIMSGQEIDRLEVVQKMDARLLSRQTGAQQLGLSMRQTIRLLKGYRQLGVSALISKRRGKTGNRQHDHTLKHKVIEQVKAHYVDFGPTLASEKLKERHQIQINKETLRQWMIEAGLWKKKSRKHAVIHQQRARRSCLGELVQIDGSPHDWFEGRRGRCCLLVFIDDATSQLLQLRFEETETTQGYFRAAREYFKHHGRPLAFYNDKHGIFRVNRAEAKTGTGETQFGRVMRELGVKIICANSPQAKGRVERANGTLQDRLVKELRLQEINDIDSANAFLPAFMEDYNKRFAATAANATDAHRKTLPKESVLDLIFTLQCQRTLSKNLELSYNNIIYQVKTSGKSYGMRYAKVTVCDNEKGQVTLIYKHKILSYEIFDKKNQPSPIANSKEIHTKIDRCCTGHKPSAHHPWRQYNQIAINQRQRI